LTISISVILKEEWIMSNAVLSIKAKLSRTGERIRHPFRVIVGKEMADHIRSWRFVILIAIIALTSIGSLYTAMANFSQAVKPNDPEGTFFFLELFTITDGTMPSFTVFISFLGPLLGIALGFDAINSEHNRGTLGRMLSQPIHRDYIINAKFTAALPGPLPLGQSLLMVWPQVTGLAAGTIISFVISYILFMRREIRSR